MTWLRLRLKQMTRELGDMKSVLQLLVTAPDRAAAATWAAELGRNGFQDYTAEDVRLSLQVSATTDDHRVLYSQSPVSGAGLPLMLPLTDSVLA
jgi:hypothetical protein